MAKTESLPSSSAAPAESIAPAAPVAAPTNGFSLTALGLGIAGIALGQGLLSVAAVVLGFIARNREPGSRIMANWGLVLGFVGVFGGILFGIIGFAAFAPLWVGAGIWGWDVANIGLWDVWNR